MKIPFSRLDIMHAHIESELFNAYCSVLKNSHFIQGQECKLFEKEFAEYNRVKYCVGVASGLDALILALKAVGVKKGDEVIVPGNTFIATVLAISYVGATPILVDPDFLTCNINAEEISKKINKKTKAIIPVHLYGQMCDMTSIMTLAKKNNLKVIEDCAQAHGSVLCGKHAGAFGDIGCYSFYPGKNLGALGDGGAIITNNKVYAKKIRRLGNYGTDYKYHNVYKGINSRLDEMQASFLRIKLRYLDTYIKERRKIANEYLNKIKNPLIRLPKVLNQESHTWHIFPIFCKYRDVLFNYLKNKGIDCIMHYPISIRNQPCYKELDCYTPVSDKLSKTEISLPIFIGMKNSEIKYVIKALNEFKKK